MVCYICNSPASLECPECHRYVCTKHTSGQHYGSYGSYFSLPYLCKNCALQKETIAQAEKMRLEKVMEEEGKKNWYCDFCGKVIVSSEGGFTDSYKCKLPKCGICKKAYCSKHGQLLRNERTESYEYWFRCIEHLYKPGILGYWNLNLTGSFFDTFLLGKPDEEDSKY